MSYDIIEKLKQEIGGFQDNPKLESFGEVVESGDGIAKIAGLTKTVSQELLTIETAHGPQQAIAFNLEDSMIGAVLLGVGTKVSVGDRVSGTGTVLSIPVGKALLGRVVNPLAEAIDGKGTVFQNEKDATLYRIERGAPNVVSRESVGVPLHTGIKAIDAMVPIGRGQRELIIGDRQTGKTSVAIDTILNQQGENVVCVYVAIGQKNSKIARIVQQLHEKGAMEYTVVVSAPADAPTSLQYLAPFAGCAIGEYFMDQGKDALVIYDDLSKHADAYRELSLLLRRPPGREAYPGDIFYLHARLLERAARLDQAHGGGSLTALPIIETKLNDVSAYIPTNVISITDGQIYLESDLFYQGVRPAVNVGLSVSRVGSSAQTKAMKKVAGKLRLELAQFRELQAFVQFASDLDPDTRARIARGDLLTELLKQPDGSPMPFYVQTIVLYSAINGYMDDVSKDHIGRFEKEYVEYFTARHQNDILDVIKEKRTIDEGVEEKLKGAIDQFKKIFK